MVEEGETGDVKREKERDFVKYNTRHNTPPVYYFNAG